MALARSDEEALELVDRVVEVCSRIVLTNAHRKQVTHFFRTQGNRFPGQTSRLLRELDEHPEEKLVVVRKSKIKPLDSKQAKLLKGRRHDDVSDDKMLVEAARAAAASIITLDPHVLKKHAVWKKKLGVGVYSPDQVES